jgi:hypothetical protein
MRPERAIDRSKRVLKSPALELDSRESLHRIEIDWIGVEDGAIPCFGFGKLARPIQCGRFLESRFPRR